MDSDIQGGSRSIPQPPEPSSNNEPKNIVAQTEQSAEEELPKLSPEEFRRYNIIAETMEQFSTTGSQKPGRFSMSDQHAYTSARRRRKKHNHFRREWNQIYAAVSPPAAHNTAAATLPASRLIGLGLAFINHLTMHHDIEEAHIFPQLGARMPAFAPGDTGPIAQHRAIHAGLDALQEYLLACKHGERELRREELKEILDGFREVLWQHLEEEVWHLGAERMRRYWTLEEMRHMPL